MNNTSPIFFLKCKTPLKNQTTIALELSFDMIEDILSWVSSRSLPRLKSICKPWETLITDSRFMKKHL
ncbi:putative F-box domain-containing protein [Arabidopsis thaliana]